MDQGAVESLATSDRSQQPSASLEPKAFSSAFAVDAASLPARCHAVELASRRWRYASADARRVGDGARARRHGKRVPDARRAARRRRGVVGRRGAASVS
tara:strand:- start:270 stop:566 length:297 start_codon:yes stop_codon:yes gene_type:complete